MPQGINNPTAVSVFALSLHSGFQEARDPHLNSRCAPSQVSSAKQAPVCLTPQPHIEQFPSNWKERMGLCLHVPLHQVQTIKYTTQKDIGATMNTINEQLQNRYYLCQMDKDVGYRLWLVIFSDLSGSQTMWTRMQSISRFTTREQGRGQPWVFSKASWPLWYLQSIIKLELDTLAL